MLRMSYSDHFLPVSACVCYHFQMISPLKPLSKFCLLRLREQKIAKMVAVCWPWWPPYPYMVKTFKNLHLQNRGCLGAESLHKSLGMGGLPKLLKWWLYSDIWPFRAWSSLLPSAFEWDLYICMRKNVENCKWLLLWSHLANVSQISCGAYLGQGKEKLLKCWCITWYTFPADASHDLLSLLKHHMIYFPCWCITWSTFPADASHDLLSLLVYHMIYFPCWCITWSTFPVDASLDLLSLLVLHMVFFSLLVFHKLPVLKFAITTK